VTSVLVPWITFPPAVPEALCASIAPCGCEAETEDSRLFRCLLECGLSGAAPTPEEIAEPVEAAQPAPPQCISPELPSSQHEVTGGARLAALPASEQIAGSRTSRPQTVISSEVFEAHEGISAERPTFRRSLAELPDKEEEGSQQEEARPEASQNVAATATVVEFIPLPEVPDPPLSEQSLWEAKAHRMAPAAEPVQAPPPAPQDPNLAFRLLLRPQEPQQTSEAAPHLPPEDNPPATAAHAALRQSAVPEHTETRHAAPRQITPKRPEMRSNSGTPDILKDAIPDSKPAATAGTSKAAGSEAGDAVRAPLEELRVLDSRRATGESGGGPLPEQRGAPQDPQPRPHGVDVARESGAPPKDERGPALPPPAVNRESRFEDRAAPPAAARQVFVRVDRAGARPVDIGLAEKAGRVEVSVRSADAGLNRALREDLGDLVGRLRQEGFEAAGWASREVSGAERTQWAANERGAAEERESAPQRFDQPEEQRHRKRAAQPWLEAWDAESERQGGKR